MEEARTGWEGVGGGERERERVEEKGDQSSSQPKERSGRH